MNIWLTHNNEIENRLGTIHKRNFWRRKWSKSTALYNMFYKKTVQKWMPIPITIARKKTTETTYRSRNWADREIEYWSFQARQSLWDLFPDEFATIQNQHQIETSNLINSILYHKDFTHQLYQQSIHSLKSSIHSLQQCLSAIFRKR